MKQYEYEVTFIFDRFKITNIYFTGNEQQALILAQADMIKFGNDYTRPYRIKRIDQLWNFKKLKQKENK